MNPPITRRDALVMRLTHYYTGKPCKYGHFAKRYTKTQSCVECVHPKFETTDKEERGRQQGIIETLKDRMVLVHIRIYPEDLEFFKDYILRGCQEQYTEGKLLQMKHIKTRHKPRAIGARQSIHTFNTFDNLIPALYFLQDNFETQRAGTSAPPSKATVLPKIKKSDIRIFPTGDPWK